METTEVLENREIDKKYFMFALSKCCWYCWTCTLGGCCDDKIEQLLATSQRTLQAYHGLRRCQPHGC